MATSGYLVLATRGYFFMATDTPSTKTFRGVLSINHVDVLDYVQYWCELPSGWAIPLEPDTITVITAE